MGTHAARPQLAKHGFRALNSIVVPLVKAGVGSPLPVGVGLVVVETTGRRTGKRREVPLVAARLGSSIAVSTVRQRSLWVKNIQADPRVAVWVCGKKRAAKATVADGPVQVAALQLDESAPEAS